MPDFFRLSSSADQGDGIDHGARADDRFLPGAQNAAGNELQHVAMAIEDDGVAGVVSAGVARGVVERRSEVVDHLPFSFVAPLRADYRDCFGLSFLRHPEHSGHTRCALCPPRSNLETLQGGWCGKNRFMMVRRGACENKPALKAFPE